jgi:spore coat polysaccharide biosynthesis protein SpsF
MVVGQPGSPKVGAIIQARMKSTRLPGKVLMPLPVEATDALITWPIRSLKNSTLIADIILATSENVENSPLKDVADQQNVLFFQGDENDVLSRFVEAAIQHELDVIVRITGDNPIIDVRLIDELLSLHLAGEFEYSYSDNLPVGMNVEIVNASVLSAILLNKDLTDADREHVTFFIRRTGLFKVLKHEFKGIIDRKIRLTVDCPADYATLNLVSQIARKFLLEGMDLVHLIERDYPWIFEVNSHLTQRNQYGNLHEELPAAIEVLNSNELKFTANFLLSKAGDI